ncbi:MAG: hypothetical protein J5874_01555 [Oscillospiraceae bacterium]|nr:hypothetical protein [Oscillospiraceae bacterium]
MKQRISDEQQVKLAKLFMLNKMPQEQILEILLSIDTQEKLLNFLDKMSEKNYEATPEEIYQMSGEAVIEEM